MPNSCSHRCLLPIKQKGEKKKKDLFYPHDLLHHIPQPLQRLSSPGEQMLPNALARKKSKFQASGEMPAAVRAHDVQIAAGDLRERSSPSPGAPIDNPAWGTSAPGKDAGLTISGKKEKKKSPGTFVIALNDLFSHLGTELHRGFRRS